MGSGHTVTAFYEIIPPGQPVPEVGVDPLKYQDKASLSAAAGAGELMTIKLRYKRPEASSSERTADVVGWYAAARNMMGVLFAPATIMLPRRQICRGLAVRWGRVW